jgi:hypothetical protein
MELPMVAPAPVVRNRAVACRALVDYHCQCRDAQHYLTGMIILPNNSMGISPVVFWRAPAHPV